MNENISNTVSSTGLMKRMLIGGIIGLVLITLFLISADEADPSWNKLWFIKPLIITPIAAAMGGGLHFYVDKIFSTNNWSRVLAFIVSTLGFVVTLWLGTVLGLNGTYWN
ncbi:potassium transporter KefB [Roseivirga sp. UBA1976]|uniref:potassium transporter KefB n=1 Tax=Roseivirga sp. UBA1976 TaxID=1947386 RepID=UPI00257C053C|nr:potassium transporter KefB [Roseivirga sp. UBA1976]|tara:strand:+ start:2343 stop:2672 length:330 start_codon:yes stop_codon:yes gene_type:complete